MRPRHTPEKLKGLFKTFASAKLINRARAQHSLMTDKNIVEVVVEIPKGSRNKYEYDSERGVMVFDRMLYSAMHYPGDYGFIPETLGLDGDPIDALVLVSNATFPGCYIRCRVVGVMNMSDDKGQDEKIICVPLGDPRWKGVDCLDDINNHYLKEIEHFFRVYKDLEQKQVQIQGWDDAKAAMQIIADARERHKKRS